MRTGAILLLCIYAVAAGHELFPHHHAGQDADSCALCLLLASAALVSLALIVGPVGASCVRIPCPGVRVFSRRMRQAYSLRGPPCASH